jgi:hypothetical protein
VNALGAAAIAAAAAPAVNTVRLVESTIPSLLHVRFATASQIVAQRDARVAGGECRVYPDVAGKRIRISDEERTCCEWSLLSLLLS